MTRRTLQSYAQWPRARLESEIRRHNRLYFLEGAPEISDAAFDRMLAVLRDRFPDSPVLTEIGSDLAMGEREKIRHAAPMLSLDKCASLDTLQAWADKTGDDFVAMPKIDGVAMSLRYDARGHLAVAATRGDGTVGEDVTANVQGVAEIPQRITLRNVEVRGEIYMPLSVFRQRFAESFASPRNLAAGALKQKDPRKTAAFHLRFLAYDLLGSDAATELAKRKCLHEVGIPAAPTQHCRRATLPQTIDRFVRERAQLDYETDGVVLRLNDVAAQDHVGATAHHPRFAMAYKYAGDAAQTTLEAIEWSVARSHVITPVGIIAPVLLSGAMVHRVSLHNYGLAKKLGVGVGATVEVMRRGGVIPHLERVITPGPRVLRAPGKCPSCGNATRIDGDFVYCTNPRGCGRALVGALKHFLDALGCEGFGPALLAHLVDAGIVTDPADLFALTVDALTQLERMGPTLATKLVRNLDGVRQVSLEQFLRALGIHELARHTSRVLAGFGSLDRVLAVSEEELAALHGIGPQIAHAVVAGLREKSPLIDKLRAILHITASQRKSKTGGRLAGKSVLFTGTLAAMSRPVAQALVEAQGGQVASGVSKTLQYLVVGSEGGAGSKLTKAQALVDAGAALQIVSEAEFLQLVGRK